MFRKHPESSKDNINSPVKPSTAASIIYHSPFHRH